MEHYYSENPTSESEERELEYIIEGTKFKWLSDNGVFSKNHVDFATDFLLKTILKEELEGKVLDIGCGYGVIGVTLAKLRKVQITMIDVNKRALALTEKNKAQNGVKAKVILSDGFKEIKEKFVCIVTNPPIRAGKANLYEIYSQAKEHLEPGGCFYLVINKKHGAPSTITYLNGLFGNCEVLDKKAGFHVIKCVKC